MPTATSVHISRALDTMSLAFQNAPGSYTWNRGSSNINVEDEAGSFFVYSRELGSGKGQIGATWPARRSLRLPGSEALEMDYTLSTEAYQCREYARRDFISDKEINKSDSPLMPLQDAAAELMNTLANEVEDLWARFVCDADNYNAANKVTLTTGGSGTSWGSGSYASASSSPLGNLRTGRAAIIKTLQRAPNTLILGDAVAQALADHPEVKDIVKYTNGQAWIEGTGLPEEIRGLNIIVASAVANTAAPGAAYSGDFIFKDPDGTNAQVAILCYVPPGQNHGKRQVSSFGRFLCPDQTTKKRGITLRQWRDEARKGVIIEAAITIDFRAIVQDSSDLISGAYLIREATV